MLLSCTTQWYKYTNCSYISGSLSLKLMILTIKLEFLPKADKVLTWIYWVPSSSVTIRHSLIWVFLRFAQKRDLSEIPPKAGDLREIPRFLGDIRTQIP